MRGRPTTTSHPDEWSRAVQGDRRAFEALVGPYVPRALGLAGRLLGQRADAEDAVQDALLKTHAHLSDVRDANGFGAWFLSVVYRQALDALRRRDTRARHELVLRPGHAPSAADTSAERDTLRRVRELLDEVAPKERAALHLRVVDKLSYDAIGAVLGLSPASARVYVAAARRHLRAGLGGELLP